MKARLFTSLVMGVALLSLASRVASAQQHDAAREARTEEVNRIMGRVGREPVEIDVTEPLPAARHDPLWSPAPRPNAVWIPGFWHWEGSTADGLWLWVGSHWDDIAHDRGVWIGPRYDHLPGGNLHYVSGYWH